MFERARAVVGLSAAQAVADGLEFRLEGLNFLVLPEHHVAQFRARALQEGDLGLDLFQRLVVHLRSVALTRRRRTKRGALCKYLSLLGLSGSEIVGRTLRYTRTFEIKELSVPVSKAEQLRDFYRVIAGDERNSAILKRVSQ